MNTHSIVTIVSSGVILAFFLREDQTIRDTWRRARKAYSRQMDAAWTFCAEALRALWTGLRVAIKDSPKVARGLLRDTGRESRIFLRDMGSLLRDMLQSFLAILGAAGVLIKATARGARASLRNAGYHSVARLLRSASGALTAARREDRAPSPENVALRRTRVTAAVADRLLGREDGSELTEEFRDHIECLVKTRQRVPRTIGLKMIVRAVLPIAIHKLSARVKARVIG